MTVLSKSEIYDLLADNIAFFEAMIDTGIINYASPPMETMFGYTLRGELEGQEVELLIADQHKEIHRNIHRVAFSTDPKPRMMGQRRIPLLALRKDKTTFPIEIFLIPRAASGKKVVIGMVLDMSSRQGDSGVLKKSSVH